MNRRPAPKLLRPWRMTQLIISLHTTSATAAIAAPRSRQDDSNPSSPTPGWWDASWTPVPVASLVISAVNHRQASSASRNLITAYTTHGYAWPASTNPCRRNNVRGLNWVKHLFRVLLNFINLAMRQASTLNAALWRRCWWWGRITSGELGTGQAKSRESVISVCSGGWCVAGWS